MGWCFEETEELLTGRYHFAAHDKDGNLLAEKEITVI